MGDIQTRRAAELLPSPPAERREKLTYMADMLNELQTIAEKEGCETLAGLLALSQTEALRKASAS